jgi:flagellar biogenesis protein FliO
VTFLKRSGVISLQNEGVLVFMQFLGVLFIIFLAYVGTKWISKKYSNISSGNQMKVLERISLGQDKSIVLVLSEKRYLLG